jgi:uncharacterized membrane protein YkvA (DUF1232 family)
MAAMKFSIVLEDSDVAYFRSLYRKAKQAAEEIDEGKIIAEVRGLVERVRAEKRVPSFVRDAVQTLEQMIGMLKDEEYDLPKDVGRKVLAALAYFANPQDLIHDSIPGLGFLDDAIIVMILREDFRWELEAYEKFTRFRQGAEQRPWTAVAKTRLPARLAAKRKELRGWVEEKNRAAEAKRTSIWR